MKSDITASQGPSIFQLVLALPCDLTGMETLCMSHLGILPSGGRCNRASSSHDATGGSQDSNWSTLQIQPKLLPIIFTDSTISCGSTLSCVFESKIQQSKSWPNLTTPLESSTEAMGETIRGSKSRGNWRDSGWDLTRYICFETEKAFSGSESKTGEWVFSPLPSLVHHFMLHCYLTTPRFLLNRLWFFSARMKWRAYSHWTETVPHHALHRGLNFTKEIGEGKGFKPEINSSREPPGEGLWDRSFPELSNHRSNSFFFFFPPEIT